MLRKAKHSKPSKLKPLLVAGGLTAGLAVADASLLSSAASAASGSDFSKLRQCESGGDYSINTGNGYYGAYQFDVPTWQGLGYSGLPSSASAGTQDEAARRLQSQRGWQPWPACSRSLGLNSARGSAEPASSTHAATTTRSTTPRASRSTRVERPSTSTRTVRTSGYSSNVRNWQAQMADRGWTIAVDGYYGPQSRGVAAAFAREKGLRIPAGSLSRTVYRAAFSLPVT